jgi:heterodisulfide reductase subunit B
VSSVKLLYYPGCALKSTAAELERSTFAVARLLGLELTEIDKWYCCGVVHNLAVDSEMYFVAPARNLSRAQAMARELNLPGKLVAVCSMCYSTLKQANSALKSDHEKLDRITKFMDNEEPYKGEMEVVHFSELFKDILQPKALEKHVKRSLNGLRVAPYYGCVLLRPKETAIVDPNNPEVFEGIISAVGGVPVSYPKRDECCGSYQTVLSKQITLSKGSQILGSAEEWDAQLVATMCPLCHFNLKLSKEEAEKEERRKLIPALYLTEILCYAFGLDDILTEGSRELMSSLVEKSSKEK